MEIPDLEPILSAFCEEHGFRDTSWDLGRYPRMRITRESNELRLFFSVDIADEYRLIEAEAPLPDDETRFYVGMGAWWDSGNQRTSLLRPGGDPLRLGDLKNGALLRILDRGLEEMSGWTRDYVRAHGKVTPLG